MGRQEATADNDEKSVLKEVSVSFIREFLEFLKTRKKFWLLPVILIMLLFGLLIILGQNSAVAPFIYTLF